MDFPKVENDFQDLLLVLVGTILELKIRIFQSALRPDE